MTFLLLTAGDSSLSDEELLGNVKVFFLAGSDTTSVVMTTHPPINTLYDNTVQYRTNTL